MKKSRYVIAVFDNEIKAHEIAAFRGAIAQKVGLKNDLFHNHDSNGKFINRYPAIQYKRIGLKPAIFAIGNGTDEIHKFFEKKDWKIEISGRELEMKLDRLDLRTHTFQVWNGFMNKFNCSRYNFRSKQTIKHSRCLDLFRVTIPA